MLRRFVSSNLPSVAKSLTSTNRAPLVVQSLQRATVFVDFPKDDKFTKDKQKYPSLVEGIKGDYAKDLFRLGYNTNQLGYIKLSLEEIQNWTEKLGGILPLDIATIQNAMKDAGLTPEVANDFLKAIYDKGLTKDFKAIVEDYNQLYNSYFNITTGSIILGDPINPKYTVYLNEIKMVAVGTLAEDKVRVTFTTEYSTNDFGGWKADIGGNAIDSTQANELELLVGSRRDVSQVLDA